MECDEDVKAQNDGGCKNADSDIHKKPKENNE